MLLEQVTDEAEAVAVHAGGVDADEDVALLDELRAPELVALGDADGEAGHVEVAARELPGVLGGLAAEQHALGPQAALVDAGDDVGDLLGHDLADDEVVEEEQRDGAAGGDVVDAHRDEVDADGVEPADAAGDLDLGAHAVGAGHEHGVLEARQAHGAAEPAEAAEDERVLRALQPLLHELDGAVARLDVDPGLLVREPLVLRHDAPRSVVRQVYVLPRPACQCPGAVSRRAATSYHPRMGLRSTARRARVGAAAVLARRARRRCSRRGRVRPRAARLLGAASRPRTTASYKVDLLERLPAPPELVIFGGSRAQRFEPSFAEKLTGLPAFNFAVQNSRPEDVYAMSRLLFWRAPSVKLRCIWALQATTLSDSPLHPGLLAEPRLTQFLPGYLVAAQRKVSVSTEGREMATDDEYSARGQLLRNGYDLRLERGDLLREHPARTTSPRWSPGRPRRRPTRRRARGRTSSAPSSSSTCTAWSRCW